jgi:hypothetical protein
LTGRKKVVEPGGASIGAELLIFAGLRLGSEEWVSVGLGVMP